MLDFDKDSVFYGLKNDFQTAKRTYEDKKNSK
jgi:hypothetical protein